jgi:hypothetical protein
MDDTEEADRIVISYPDALGPWRADQLKDDRFKNYLRKTLGEVHEGHKFEEFVDIGCCGETPDIPLRVETVEGGPVVGPDTVIDWVEREGEVEGGWDVQPMESTP